MEHLVLKVLEFDISVPTRFVILILLLLLYSCSIPPHLPPATCSSLSWVRWLNVTIGPRPSLWWVDEGYNGLNFHVHGNCIMIILS